MLEHMQARGLALVTPADADLARKPAMALFVGGAGNLRVTTVDGNDVLLPVPAGFVLNCLVTRVWSTNTTATLIFAYYA